MNVKGRPITIYVDDDFLASLDRWAEAEQVSRSLGIRQIVTKFLSEDESGAQ